MSHDIQNEILQTMAHQIQLSIVKEDHASTWYSVISDETVAASLVNRVCYGKLSVRNNYIPSTARSRWD